MDEQMKKKIDKEHLDILQCGTEVILKRCEYEGVITCIQIRGSYVTYEVSYYNNGDLKVVFVNDYEFIIKNIGEKHIEIGFHE